MPTLAIVWCFNCLCITRTRRHNQGRNVGCGDVKWFWRSFNDSCKLTVSRKPIAIGIMKVQKVHRLTQREVATIG